MYKSEYDTDYSSRTAGQYPRTTPARQAAQRGRERTHAIKFLKYVLLGLMTQEEASRALKVSVSTLDRWKLAYLDDGEPDTDDLRKLLQARKHRKFMNPEQHI